MGKTSIFINGIIGPILVDTFLWKNCLEEIVEYKDLLIDINR